MTGREAGGPLARVGAIKLKLGAMIIGGILVSLVVVIGGTAADLPLWLTVIVAIALSVVAVELLGSGLTAPLREMAHQADRLAAGEPVEAVTDTARDEVGALARAFNRMATEVAQTDRVRRDLVANVSHELRTPLAALTAVLENVVDGVEEAGPDALGRMTHQVDRLGRLVSQLLDLSQLDAGAVTLDRGPVEVASLLDEAVRGFADHGGDRIVIDAPTTLRADLDRDRVAQVIVNLVGNALRHGPADTPVHLTAREDTAAGLLTIRVTDEGPGISSEDAERVFERFARADDGRASTIGGTGLGLAITRWIVELHGGTVRVDRPGVPGGRLLVELPMQTTGTMPPPDPSTFVVAGATATSTSVAARRDAASDTLRVLPTPVAGLTRRGLIAALLAGVIAALLLPLESPSPVNLGMALVLLGGAVGAIVAVERPLDWFAKACVGIAVVIAASWALTDTVWLLLPLTFGASLLAGLGLWGPRTFGEAFRALAVGPLLTVATPVALLRRDKPADPGGAGATSILVPVAATVTVLLVFGSLLAGVDVVFADLLGRVLPAISIDGSLIGRIIAGVFATALVITYVLVQRAGTVPVVPWQRPVRPARDWAMPLGSLVALFAAFVAVQIRVLFGGSQLVQDTLGLTYADYARQGFGQSVLVALLTLVVIGVVVRVAADADRRLRDGLVGSLMLLTLVMVASATHRLVIYMEAFGLTRSRLVGLAVLAWVALMLLLVALSGRLPRVRDSLPRLAIVVSGLVAVTFLAVRPDVLIAQVNIERYERTGQLDAWYLLSLSADAAPTIVAAEGLVADLVLEDFLATNAIGSSSRICDLERALGLHLIDGVGDGLLDWNLARFRADDAVAQHLTC